MKCKFIRDHENDFNIRRMCLVLGVKRSSYYAWRNRSESYRKLEDKELLKEIVKIHEDSSRRYGSLKVHKELRELGFICGHNRAARIMRENGLRSKLTKKYRNCSGTVKDDTAKDNLLNREFNPDNPNEVWVTDITYIHTSSGWMYLCVFMDLFSRLIVGWSVADHMRTELVIEALDKACKNRKPGEGLMIHSDRGTQFGSKEYTCYLSDNGFRQSMSRRGNCWDNACVESFFKILKYEELNYIKHSGCTDLKWSLFKYIDVFYNRKRIHSTLGYESPMNYEKKVA